MYQSKTCLFISASFLLLLLGGSSDSLLPQLLLGCLPLVELLNPLLQLGIGLLDLFELSLGSLILHCLADSEDLRRCGLGLNRIN